MDNFENLRKIQEELNRLQQQFNEYTSSLETSDDIPKSYRKDLESQIGRTSCDIQNAKENIDQIRTSMKDGFIAQFIIMIDRMTTELGKIPMQVLAMGLATGLVNPFKEIASFLQKNKVGDYFNDMIDFFMSLLTGLVKYLQSSDGVMDDLKINLSSLIELFDRVVIKDEIKMFESKSQPEMSEMATLVSIGRGLVLNTLTEIGFDPKERLLDFFLKYDRVGMRTEIGMNIMDTYQDSDNVHFSKILEDFIKKLEKLRKEEDRNNNKNKKNDSDDNDDNTKYSEWGTDGHNNNNDDDDRDPYDVNDDSDSDSDHDSNNDDDDDDNDGSTKIPVCFFSGCGNDQTENNKRPRDDDDNNDDGDNKRSKN